MDASPNTSQLPTLRLKRGEDRRLSAGHLWVFSNEVDSERTPLAAFAPGDHRTLYMGAQHVLASDDRGLTWRRISGDLAAIPGAPVP